MAGRLGLRGYLASASLLALLQAAPARADTWTASIDGLGQAGSEGGGGALDLLVPLYQDADTLLFTNLLGGLDSDSAKAAALGLVLRQRFDAGFILGGYGYLDFQRSADGEAFPQVVAGLEFKTEDWDLHLTGYAPLSGVDTLRSVAPQGASGVLGPGQLVIDGNQLLLRHDVIGALPGADGLRVEAAALYGTEAAVGWRLPLDGALGRNIDASLYLGGYAFGRAGFDTYAGPEARLEVRLHDMAFLGDGSRLTASLETAWDEPRGLQGTGLLRVRIPLGALFGGGEGHAMDRLDRRMVDPVQRDMVALTDERHDVLAAPTTTPLASFDESVRDAETDRTIALVYFADGGAAVSDGSAGDPTSLADAVGSKGMTGNAATDALIVVSGEAGPITGNISLAGNQILLGGGSTLQVLGNVTDEMATFTPTAFDAAASRPTITHDGTVGAAVLSAVGVDHMKLVGLDITIANQSLMGLQQYRGIRLVDSAHDIVRDVAVTGGDMAFLLDAVNAAVDEVLLEDIAVTGSSFGVGAFSSSTDRVSNVTVNRGTFTSLTRAVGAAFAFNVNAGGAQTVDNLALNDIVVTDTDWGGSFQKVNGLAIDGWTGTGHDTAASGSVGLAVSNGTAFTLRDFSISDYRAGIQILNNGTGNSIDGSVRGVIADIGTMAALGVTGIVSHNSDITIDSVSISGVGSAAFTADFALQISGPATVRITNVSIDGRNSDGDLVTDSAVFLSGTVATDDITILAGSSGNSAINVTQLCFQVMGPASVSGQIVFTVPAATCP